MTKHHFLLSSQSYLHIPSFDLIINIFFYSKKENIDIEIEKEKGYFIHKIIEFIKYSS